MNPEQLTTAIEWAKNNPNDPRAVELRKRIEEGTFNNELQAAGMKTFPVKPPPQPKFDTTNVDVQSAITSVEQEKGLQTEIPNENIISMGVFDGAEGIKETAGDVKETLVDIGATAKERAGDVNEIVQDEDLNVLQKIMGTIGQVSGGVAEAIGEATVGAGKVVLTDMGEQSFVENVAKPIAEQAEKVTNSSIGQKVQEWYGGLDKDNKLVVDSVGGVAAIMAELIGLKGTGRLKNLVAQGVDTAAPIVRKGAGETIDLGVRQVEGMQTRIGETVANRNARIAAQKAQAEREVVQEMIAPGVNAKEVRKAMDEGRLTRGEQGFWFGKKPDAIEVSEKIKNISDTISRRIPNAAMLDDVGLNNRLKVEIETTADNLKPRMAEVKLRDVTPTETAIVKVAKQYDTPEAFVDAFNRGELDADTVNRIRNEYGEDIFDDQTALADLFNRSKNPSMIDVAFNSWDTIKKQQQNSTEFLEFAGAPRFQEIFESYLNRLRKGTKEKTLDDVWEIRKAYDQSIPERVKNANDVSPISTQIQKEMWLQNRRILNDIINDSARGLGKESAQAFKEMSDMYTARENIISKTKLDTKGKPGAIQKVKESTVDQVIPFGIGALIF